jgi:hypothetical protein
LPTRRESQREEVGIVRIRMFLREEMGELADQISGCVVLPL